MKLLQFFRSAFPLILVCVWVSPLQAQMTKQEAEQYTTNRLLGTLQEVLKRPEGETKAQRQQRMQNRVNELVEQDAAVTQQQRDYHYTVRKKLVNEGYDGGNEAHQDIARRLNPQNHEAEGSRNPNAKQAGFDSSTYSSEAYVDSGQAPLELSGVAVNSSRSQGAGSAGRGRSRASKAPDVEEVAPPSRATAKAPDSTTTEKPKTKYCSCKGGDWNEYGGWCLPIGGGIGDDYEPGHYLWTPQCRVVSWK